MPFGGLVVNRVHPLDGGPPEADVDELTAALGDAKLAAKVARAYAEERALAERDAAAIEHLCRETGDERPDRRPAARRRRPRRRRAGGDPSAPVCRLAEGRRSGGASPASALRVRALRGQGTEERVRARARAAGGLPPALAGGLAAGPRGAACRRPAPSRGGLPPALACGLPPALAGRPAAGLRGSRAACRRPSRGGVAPPSRAARWKSGRSSRRPFAPPGPPARRGGVPLGSVRELPLRVGCVCGAAGFDRVVPLGVELVAVDVDGVQFGVGDFDLGGIGARIEAGVDLRVRCLWSSRRSG